MAISKFKDWVINELENTAAPGTANTIQNTELNKPKTEPETPAVDPIDILLGGTGLPQNTGKQVVKFMQVASKKLNETKMAKLLAHIIQISGFDTDKLNRVLFQAKNPPQ